MLKFRERAARWAVVLAFLACAAPGLGSLRADDAKITGDLKKMQGTWVNAGDDGFALRWILEGETLKAAVNGQDYTCSLTLDPNTNPLPTVDFTIKEGPGDSVGKSAKGVYKFNGDRLIYCISIPGSDARVTSV